MLLLSVAMYTHACSWHIIYPDKKKTVPIFRNTEVLIRNKFYNFWKPLPSCTLVVTQDTKLEVKQHQEPVAGYMIPQVHLVF